MNGGSPENALDRIEAAIARIENAARQPADGDSDLLARHERLKSSVAQTLGQLDDLIAGQRE